MLQIHRCSSWIVSASCVIAVQAARADDLTEVKTYANQPDWVLSLQFAPDGKTFAAGRFDGSLEFYKVDEALRAPVHQAQNVTH